jgi:hypothetical protein
MLLKRFATAGCAPTKNAVLRGKMHRDTADKSSFTENGQRKQNQSSIGVEALLKFQLKLW